MAGKNDTMDTHPQSTQHVFSIPKLDRKRNTGTLDHVSWENRELQELLSDVKRTCYFPLDKLFNQWKITAVHMASPTAAVEERYRKKRSDSKKHRGWQEDFGFFICKNKSQASKITRNGIRFNSSRMKCLGDPSCGVYLFRYLDVALLSQVHNRTAFVFVLKVCLGRVKKVPVSDGRKPAVTEPTPNFDAHVSQTAPNSSDPVSAICSKSQVYVYEYTEEAVPAEYPNQCLPVALMEFCNSSYGQRSGQSYARLTVPGSFNSHTKQLNGPEQQQTSLKQTGSSVQSSEHYQEKKHQVSRDLMLKRKTDVVSGISHSRKSKDSAGVPHLCPDKMYPEKRRTVWRNHRLCQQKDIASGTYHSGKFKGSADVPHLHPGKVYPKERYTVSRNPRLCQQKDIASGTLHSGKFKDSADVLYSHTSEKYFEKESTSSRNPTVIQEKNMVPSTLQLRSSSDNAGIHSHLHDQPRCDGVMACINKGQGLECSLGSKQSEADPRDIRGLTWNENFVKDEDENAESLQVRRSYHQILDKSRNVQRQMRGMDRSFGSNCWSSCAGEKNYSASRHQPEDEIAQTSAPPSSLQRARRCPAVAQLSVARSARCAVSEATRPVQLPASSTNVASDVAGTSVSQDFQHNTLNLLESSSQLAMKTMGLSAHSTHSTESSSSSTELPGCQPGLPSVPKPATSDSCRSCNTVQPRNIMSASVGRLFKIMDSHQQHSLKSWDVENSAACLLPTKQTTPQERPTCQQSSSLAGPGSTLSENIDQSAEHQSGSTHQHRDVAQGPLFPVIAEDSGAVYRSRLITMQNPDCEKEEKRQSGAGSQHGQSTPVIPDGDEQDIDSECRYTDTSGNNPAAVNDTHVSSCHRCGESSPEELEESARWENTRNCCSTEKAAADGPEWRQVREKREGAQQNTACYSIQSCEKNIAGMKSMETFQQSKCAESSDVNVERRPLQHLNKKHKTRHRVDELEEGTTQCMAKDNVGTTKRMAKDNVRITQCMAKDNVRATQFIAKDNVGTTQWMTKDNVRTVQCMAKDSVKTTQCMTKNKLRTAVSDDCESLTDISEVDRTSRLAEASKGHGGSEETKADTVQTSRQKETDTEDQTKATSTCMYSEFNRVCEYDNVSEISESSLPECDLVVEGEESVTENYQITVALTLEDVEPSEVSENDVSEVSEFSLLEYSLEEKQKESVNKNDLNTDVLLEEDTGSSRGAVQNKYSVTENIVNTSSSHLADTERDTVLKMSESFFPGYISHQEKQNSLLHEKETVLLPLCDTELNKNQGPTALGHQGTTPQCPQSSNVLRTGKEYCVSEYPSTSTLSIEREIRSVPSDGVNEGDNTTARPKILTVDMDIEMATVIPKLERPFAQQNVPEMATEIPKLERPFVQQNVPEMASVIPKLERPFAWQNVPEMASVIPKSERPFARQNVPEMVPVIPKLERPFAWQNMPAHHMYRTLEDRDGNFVLMPKQLSDEFPLPTHQTGVAHTPAALGTQPSKTGTSSQVKHGASALPLSSLGLRHWTEALILPRLNPMVSLVDLFKVCAYEYSANYDLDNCATCQKVVCTNDDDGQEDNWATSQNVAGMKDEVDLEEVKGASRPPATSVTSHAFSCAVNKTEVENTKTETDSAKDCVRIENISACSVPHKSYIEVEDDGTSDVPRESCEHTEAEDATIHDSGLSIPVVADIVTSPSESVTEMKDDAEYQSQFPGSRQNSRSYEGTVHKIFQSGCEILEEASTNCEASLLHAVAEPKSGFDSASEIAIKENRHMWTDLAAKSSMKGWLPEENTIDLSEIQKTGNLSDHRSRDLSEHKTRDLPKHSSRDLSEHSSRDMLEHSSRDLTEHSSRDMSEHSSKDLTEHSSRDLTEHSSRDMSEHSSRDMTEHSSRDMSEHSSRDLTEHSSRSMSEHSSRGMSEHSSRGMSEHSSRDLTEHSSRDMSEHSSRDMSEHSSRGMSEQQNIEEISAEDCRVSSEEDSQLHQFLEHKLKRKIAEDRLKQQSEESGSENGIPELRLKGEESASKNGIPEHRLKSSLSAFPKRRSPATSSVRKQMYKLRGNVLGSLNYKPCYGNGKSVRSSLSSGVHLQKHFASHASDSHRETCQLGGKELTAKGKKELDLSEIQRKTALEKDAMGGCPVPSLAGRRWTPQKKQTMVQVAGSQNMTWGQPGFSSLAGPVVYCQAWSEVPVQLKQTAACTDMTVFNTSISLVVPASVQSNPAGISSTSQYSEYCQQLSQITEHPKLSARAEELDRTDDGSFQQQLSSRDDAEYFRDVIGEKRKVAAEQLSKCEVKKPRKDSSAKSCLHLEQKHRELVSLETKQESSSGLQQQKRKSASSETVKTESRNRAEKVKVNTDLNMSRCSYVDMMKNREKSGPVSALEQTQTANSGQKQLLSDCQNMGHMNSGCVQTEHVQASACGSRVLDDTSDIMDSTFSEDWHDDRENDWVSFQGVVAVDDSHREEPGVQNEEKSSGCRNSLENCVNVGICTAVIASAETNIASYTLDTLAALNLDSFTEDQISLELKILDGCSKLMEMVGNHGSQTGTDIKTVMKAFRCVMEDCRFAIQSCKENCKGRCDQPLPRELLLSDETDDMYTKEGTFVILISSITAKSYSLLLNMKTTLETALNSDSDGQQVNKKDQIVQIQQKRKNIMKAYTGILGQERLSQLQKRIRFYGLCQDHLNLVIGKESIAKMQFFSTSFEAVCQHLQIVQREMGLVQ